MKKFSIIILALILGMMFLMSCDSTEEVIPETPAVCSHENIEVRIDTFEENECQTVTTEDKYCTSCNEKIESIGRTDVFDHKFANENSKTCYCGAIEHVNKEVGEQLSLMDHLNIKLDQARKENDYNKITEIIKEIIALQENNFCVITEIIFVGSVSNCTTTFDVNENGWNIARIYENRFAHQFIFADITNGNICQAIEKATGMAEDELSEYLVTIAVNYETNGYEFYLERVVG